MASNERAASPHIYGAMIAIALHVSKVGIEKNKETSSGQRFAYRGIDDVTAVMASPFAQNSVLLIPEYIDSQTTERPTNSGHWYITKVTAKFTCKSMVDGSEIVLGPCYGQAGDSGDKDLSKAGSVALRNILLQTFLAPVGPEADPEFGDQPSTEPTPEPTPQANSGHKPQPKAKRSEQEARGGQVVDELKEPQKRILNASMARNNISPAALDSAFPKGVNTGNFNDVLSWIKGAGKP